MKYLYLIFRLFKCPHKWQRYSEVNIWEDGKDMPSNRIFVTKCARCGNIKKTKAI